jgi:hypothetical protein
MFFIEEEADMERLVTVVCALAVVSFFVTNMATAYQTGKMETKDREGHRHRPSGDGNHHLHKSGQRDNDSGSGR